jgi:hypothetical protein
MELGEDQVKRLLQSIAGRCDTHDRSSPLIIRELETDLDMPLSASSGSLTEEYADPRIIGCGNRKCEERRA